MSDDQFTQLQDQLTGLGSKVTGLDKSFGNMFVYMTKRFNRLEETKADKADVDRVYDLVDGLVKRIDDDHVERTAMKSQLNRHERWHQQTARNLGMKLE